DLAMGHNVVVTMADDYSAVAADGLTAGADSDYVQPDDSRVIAATEMVGGGQSTSVTFSTSALDSGSEYTFFCSFPGHSALMRGTLTFGG
ncbi:MAG TPA: azurin, partial [Candidatus Luteimonas excrementigallinarum]|nr:azurin [Candidatus Luteimonas excrementigallinarum]